MKNRVAFNTAPQREEKLREREERRPFKQEVNSMTTKKSRSYVLILFSITTWLYIHSYAGKGHKKAAGIWISIYIYMVVIYL